MPKEDNYKSSGKRRIKHKKGVHVDRVRHAKLEFDPKIENGPLHNRGITDIIFCLFFVIFLAAYIGVFVYGVLKGDPAKLLTPFDSNAKGCGHSPGYENYPYIYFWKITDPLSYTNGNYYKQTFCVEKCPKYENLTTSL